MINMESPSTPEGTGLTEAQAAEKFAAMMDREAPSEDGEPLEEETPQSEAEDDASEEVEDDAEDGSEDEEGDEPSQQQLDDQTPVKVKLGDEEVEVTLHELKRGFLRERDYHSKTQALAEQRKSLDAEKTDFAPFVERTKAILEHLEQAYRAPLYDEQEMAALRFENPAEYAARFVEMQQRQQQIEAILGEKSKLETFDAAEKARQAQVEAQERADRAAKTEAELIKLRPEWSDPAKAKADLSAVVTLAREIGLSEEEWADVKLDHRSLLIMDEAAKYRALKAKKPQIQQRVEQVRAAKPGAATRAPAKTTDVTRAKQRLAKTGREQDAAAVFMKMLPD